MREEIIQILRDNAIPVIVVKDGFYEDAVHSPLFEEVASEILAPFKEKLKEAYNDGFGDTLYDFDAETYTE